MPPKRKKPEKRKNSNEHGAPKKKKARKKESETGPKVADSAASQATQEMDCSGEDLPLEEAMTDAELLQGLVDARYLIAASLLEGKLSAWFTSLKDEVEREACPELSKRFSQKFTMLLSDIDKERKKTGLPSVYSLFESAVLGIPLIHRDKTQASVAVARKDSMRPKPALIHHQSSGERGIPGVMPASPQKKAATLTLMKQFLQDFPLVADFFKANLGSIKEVAQTYRIHIKKQYGREVSTPEINSGDTEPDEEAAEATAPAKRGSFASAASAFRAVAPSSAAFTVSSALANK